MLGQSVALPPEVYNGTLVGVPIVLGLVLASEILEPVVVVPAHGPKRTLVAPRRQQNPTLISGKAEL